MRTDEITIDRDIAALIPPPSDEELRQLEANLIGEGGARDPLVCWSDGGRLVLLDGHNRHRICTMHGLPWSVHEIELQDRGAAMEWVIRNQFGRRNLSAYVRTQLALRLEETIAKRAKAKERERKSATGQKSAQSIATRREVAALASVSHDTVAKVKQIDAAERAGKVDAETVARLRTGEVSINRVVRDIRQAEVDARRERQRSEALARTSSIAGLHVGDFRELGNIVPDESVDLVFTDPPYDRRSIELLAPLGEFAARVLRPGGSLIAYVGQIQLPDALADFATHLRYWWTCSCHHGGPSLLRMNEYGIVNGWKPMVWFVKETRGDKETFVLDVASGTREKSHHGWQQAESEARYFIELLTRPGDMVVDPFCGGGTTPAACISLGRRWTAFEIDPATAVVASERLNERTREAG